MVLSLQRSHVQKVTQAFNAQLGHFWGAWRRENEAFGEREIGAALEWRGRAHLLCFC